MVYVKGLKRNLHTSGRVHKSQKNNPKYVIKLNIIRST